MTSTPYIYLGDKQEATQSDFATALMDLIDEFALTSDDYAKVKEILDDNGISYEV